MGRGAGRDRRARREGRGSSELAEAHRGHGRRRHGGARGLRRYPQLRGGRPGAVGTSRRARARAARPARPSRHGGRRLERHAVLGEGVGDRRRAHRHPGAEHRGCVPGRGHRHRPRAGRRGPRYRGGTEPAGLPERGGGGARGLGPHGHATPRPRAVARRVRGARRRCRNDPHRRARRVPPIRCPCDPGDRWGIDAGPGPGTARGLWDAADLPGCRCHELRDARAGAAAARLRPAPARGARHRRAARSRWRAPAHARRCRPDDGRRRSADLRPGTPGGDRGRDGRRDLGGRRRHRRRPARVGVLHPHGHPADGAPSRAAHRGLPSLRARHRSRGPRGRGGQGGAADGGVGGRRGLTRHRRRR